MNSTRLVRAAIAGLTLTGLLSACGGSGSGGSDAASGPVTLPFWGWANGQEAVVKAFNAAHKDVQLTYTKVTDQLTMQKQLT
ncbi:ABC transporter substrate-binding protein, partial [Streptomyces sp. NPDC007162]